MQVAMIRKVCASVILGAWVIFAAEGETKTWAGGSNTWQTASCWDPEGVPATTDEIIISSGACEYVAGSDLTLVAGGSITIGNGARFFQSGKNSWMQIKGGSILVKSGGEFDMGSSEHMNLAAGVTITVEKGAVLKMKPLSTKGGAAWSATGGVRVDGTIDWNGLSTPTKQAEIWKDIFVYGAGAVNTNLVEIQWVGARELGDMGTVYFQGFTAQNVGTRTNNVLVLKGGKYVFSTHAKTKFSGPVAWAPSDTADYGSWVDVPARSKVELVFTDSSVTTENVFEKVKDAVWSSDKAYNVLRRDGAIFEDVAAFRKAFMISGTTGDVHLNAKNGGLCIRIR